MKKYYYLFAFIQYSHNAGRWEQMFGDYERELVEFEYWDNRESGSKAKDLKIIEHKDSPCAPAAIFDSLNSGSELPQGAKEIKPRKPE